MPAALVALLLVAGSGLLLARAWPEHARPAGAPLRAGLGAVALAWLALVPSALAAALARLGALRADPTALVGPAARPPLFDLLAWPLATLLGDRAAAEALALAASGASLLLVPILARAAGLGEPAARLAPLALIAMPASLLPLAFDARGALAPPALALLLIHLLRRFGRLEGARDAAAAFLFLLLACVAGALPDAALAVLLFATTELVAADRRKALRLLGATAAALLATALVSGGRVLPVPAVASDGLAASGLALLLALGPVPVLLLIPGRAALAATPRPAPRLLGATLLAGLVLGLAGRGVGAALPCVVAVLAAAGFVRAWAAPPQSPASRVQSETQST